MDMFDITSSTPPVFTLWGTPVALSPDKHVYNQLKYKFLQLAKQETAKAEHDYYKTFRDLDTLCTKGTEWAYTYFKSAIDLALKELVARGVYDVDPSLFESTYFIKHECWDENFKKIYDQYAKIVLDEKEYEAYREACTQNRIRVRAYGFGLTNAIKGAVVAEATNAVIGVGYSIIGNILSGVYAMMGTSEKDDIFHNKETRKTILTGIYQTIVNMYKSLFDAINERCDNKLQNIVTADNEQKSQRLLNNLRNGIIAKEYACNVLRDVFILNPYAVEFYQCAVQESGDFDCNFERIAEFFMVELKPYKLTLLTQFYASLTMPTIEQAKEAKVQLIDYAARLGIPESENIHTKLVDDAIESLRVKPVRDFLASLDISSAEKAAQAKVDLLAFIAKSGIEDAISVQKIDKAIETHEIYSRTVNGKVFDTKDAAEQARTDLAARKERFLGVFRKYYGSQYHVSRLAGSASHLLEAAVEEFPIDKTDTILCLIDSTMFGSGKKGVAFGLKGVYWCNDWATSTARNFLSWEELAAGEPVRLELVDGRSDIGKIVFADKCVCGISGSGFDPKDVVDITHLLLKCFNAPLPGQNHETIESQPIHSENTTSVSNATDNKIQQPKSLSPGNVCVEQKQAKSPADIAQAIIDICQKFSKNDKSFTIHDNIPATKKANAIQHYPVDKNDQVLALLDSTVFGSAKNGLAIGLKGIYWKNDWSTSTKKNFLSWKELYENKSQFLIKSGKLSFGNDCVVDLICCQSAINGDPVDLFKILVTVFEGNESTINVSAN